MVLEALCYRQWGVGSPCQGQVPIGVTWKWQGWQWHCCAPPSFAGLPPSDLSPSLWSSLWDAPSAAFPLLQLLARVAGDGAELHDGWSLSLRRIAVAVPCGHGFGALRFILKVLHFLINSCTVLYGLWKVKKWKSNFILMVLPLTILEIKTI